MTYSVPRHLGGLGRGARESASVLIIYAAAAASRPVGTGDRPGPIVLGS